MNILLTGASGFVGNHFCGHDSIKRVVVRDSDNCSHWHSQQYQVDAIDGRTCWSGAFDGIKSIIHLAGLAHNNFYSINDYQTVNVDGTLHLAREAAKVSVKRFVFVSSIGVNGSETQRTPFSPISIENPHNDYAKSKYDAELGLKKIALETGLEVVIVRPTLVYGRNAPGNFGSLTSLVSKFPILPFGLINNKRDFIAVQNLVDLLITCAKHPNAAGHIFLASDCETVSIQEFTDAIATGLGRKIYQLPIPAFLMASAARFVGKSAMANQLLGNLQVDSSNAYEVLGWKPPYTMKQAMASLSEIKQ